MTSSLQNVSLYVLKWWKGFENLDNVLREWVKDKVQKSPAKALNRFEKQEEKKNVAVSFIV